MRRTTAAVYNGISGMADCQCLRTAELLAGCMRGYSLPYYSEWNPSTLAMSGYRRILSQKE